MHLSPELRDLFDETVEEVLRELGLVAPDADGKIHDYPLAFNEMRQHLVRDLTHPGEEVTPISGVAADVRRVHRRSGR